MYVVCWILLQTFQTYFCIQANSVDPDQTAPRGVVWSGSTLFAKLALKITSRWPSRRPLLWLAVYGLRTFEIMTHELVKIPCLLLILVHLNTVHLPGVLTSLFYYLLMSLIMAGWVANSVDIDRVYTICTGLFVPVWSVSTHFVQAVRIITEHERKCYRLICTRYQCGSFEFRG